MTAEEIVLRNGNKWDVVPHGQIQYIEADNKICKVVTVNREYILSTPLQELEDFLPKEIFIKIHRCYIVSSLYISAICKSGIIVAGRELPVSRKAQPDLNFRYRRRFY